MGLSGLRRISTTVVRRFDALRSGYRRANHRQAPGGPNTGPPNGLVVPVSGVGWVPAPSTRIGLWSGCLHKVVGEVHPVAAGEAGTPLTTAENLPGYAWIVSEERADSASEKDFVTSVERHDDEATAKSNPSYVAPSLAASRRKWIVPTAVVAVAIVIAAVLIVASGRDEGSNAKPRSSVAQTTTASGDWLQQGLAAQSAGRLDEARALYQKAIDQDPTNKLAYYNLGVIYQQLGAVKETRDAYGHALQIDAKYQPALFNLAVLETPLRPAEAVSLYQKILAINPNDANVHLNLGLLFKQIGRGPEGDAELAKALQLNPALASRVPKA